MVHAFNKAYANIDEDIDLIGKFDADIILPSNYFEILTDQFRSNSRLGLCSGILYIKKAGVWEYEAIADKSHIRGPVKLYRKECLDSMNGLRPGLGWDTADVMLAQFYGFETKTLPELHVKHLRPTGSVYNKSTSRNQGQAHYLLRYGFMISLIAALKMSFRKRKLSVLVQTMKGFMNAKKQKLQPLVTESEGHFIRKYRWKNIRKKLF